MRNGWADRARRAEMAREYMAAIEELRRLPKSDPHVKPVTRAGAGQ
jgi:hypothetical protein